MGGLLVHETARLAESRVSAWVAYDPSPKRPLGFTARVSPAGGGSESSRYTVSGKENTTAPLGQGQCC